MSRSYWIGHAFAQRPPLEAPRKLDKVELSTSLLSADDHNKVPLTPVQQVARSVARLTVRLTLTTTQQAQATAIFTTEQTTLAALVTPKQTAQAALQTAIQTNNAVGIQAQALALGRSSKNSRSWQMQRPKPPSMRS